MKIDKIEKDMQKTREKISALQSRLKELETQKTEQENLQIVQLVRSMRMTPQELKAFFSGDTPPREEAAPMEEIETQTLVDDEVYPLSYDEEQEETDYEEE